MIFRNFTMAGFKSFAEKANMEIEDGLTGIVGPNGCGKSNIVEALRWIMGESSARQLRGGELDDQWMGLGEENMEVYWLSSRVTDGVGADLIRDGIHELKHTFVRITLFLEFGEMGAIRGDGAVCGPDS